MSGGRWLLALLLAVPGCARPPEVTGAAASLGDVVLQDGVAWGLASSGSSTVGFRVSSQGGDTLVAIESPDGSAMLHDTENGRMTPLERLVVSAGAAVVLGAGGPHIMLTEATHGFAPGDSVRLTLQWARNGRMTVTVPLKNFSDATTLLESR